MLRQANQLARLVTPLGQDILGLVGFRASEGLSELYEVRITAESAGQAVDFDALIGRPAHVEMGLPGGGKRWFHGICTSAEWLGSHEDGQDHELVLRPWPWLLGHTSDCRIFHDLTAIEIIRKVFSDRGFSDYRFVTSRFYAVQHYTVQYRETDLAFVCRLMELVGLYYYFEHSADRHVMVIADGPSAHQPAEGLAEIPYLPIGGNDTKSRRQHLRSWSSARHFASGRVAFNDFNHTTPTAAMLGEAHAASRYSHGNMEIYDYPGGHPKRMEGEARARVALEARQATDQRRFGDGDAPALTPGYTTQLARHPRDEENKRYLVVRAEHAISVQSYRSGGKGGPGDAYSGRYEFHQIDKPFRAPLVTPVPRIHGLQTARVVGAEGEEIDVDDHGRILVHFHWDRRGDRSCRLRVSQVWAAAGWGGQVIPRVGMEVIVAFLEGDPDRPMVVGCVPDPQLAPVPYGLPANKTRMTLKSKTHKGTGFNEMRFEDERGREEYYMHAQKDMNVEILNDRNKQVGHDQTEAVGHDKTITVGNNHTETIGANKLLNVMQNMNRLIGLTSSEEVGIAKTTIVGVTQNIVVGKEFSITVGNSKLVMDAEGNVTILGTKFTFAASGPVQINGKVIDLN